MDKSTLSFSKYERDRQINALYSLLYEQILAFQRIPTYIQMQCTLCTTHSSDSDNDSGNNILSEFHFQPEFENPQIQSKKIIVLIDDYYTIDVSLLDGLNMLAVPLRVGDFFKVLLEE